MTSQTMNLKQPKGEFDKDDPEKRFLKEVFHSAGVLLGGFLISVFLVSREDRSLY